MEVTRSPLYEWGRVSAFMHELSDTSTSEGQMKFKRALAPGADVDKLREERITGLTNLIPISNSLDQFVAKFGEHSDNAREAILLINGFILSGEETKAIRVLDLFFGASGYGEGSSIKSILSTLNKDDFKSLLFDLRSENPLFISDEEINKMTDTPNDSDASKRPLRYTVAALYSGDAQIESTKGDLQKSIDYCREKYLTRNYEFDRDNTRSYSREEIKGLIRSDPKQAKVLINSVLTALGGRIDLVDGLNRSQVIKDALKSLDQAINIVGMGQDFDELTRRVRVLQNLLVDLIPGIDKFMVETKAGIIDNISEPRMMGPFSSSNEIVTRDITQNRGRNKLPRIWMLYNINNLVPLMKELKREDFDFLISSISTGKIPQSLISVEEVSRVDKFIEWAKGGRDLSTKPVLYAFAAMITEWRSTGDIEGAMNNLTKETPYINDKSIYSMIDSRDSEGELS